MRIATLGASKHSMVIFMVMVINVIWLINNSSGTAGNVWLWQLNNVVIT